MAQETDGPPVPYPEMTADEIEAASVPLFKELEAFLTSAMWPVACHALCNLLANAAVDPRQPLPNIQFLHRDVIVLHDIIHARLEALGESDPVPVDPGEGGAPPTTLH